MSVKPTRELDALDLAIEARRGALSPRDEPVFEQALGASAALRTAFEIGCDFDLASRIRPGDEALVARAAERALARGAERGSRRPKPIALLLAASLIIASAAAATRAVLNRREAAQSSPSAGAAAPLTAAPARAAVAPARSSAVSGSAASDAVAARERRAEPSAASSDASSSLVHPALPSSAPAASSSPRAGAHVSHEPEPPSSAAFEGAGETPARLLERAGSARRSGALGTARSLYVELQTRFPGSNEARVSYVSLGKLLLAAGRARDAEAAFVSDLGGGAGELREEALVGRADALYALGRTREESSVRQELIRLYPSSVYARRARERVLEIEQSQRVGSP